MKKLILNLFAILAFCLTSNAAIVVWGGAEKVESSPDGTTTITCGNDETAVCATIHAAYRSVVVDVDGKIVTGTSYNVSGSKIRVAP